MLQSLLWDDEVREARFPALDETVRISAKELDMSGSLVDSLTAEFDPSKFTDEYQTQLRELIDAKLKKGDDVSTEETFGEQPDEKDGDGGEVIDLMAALRASVERNRSGSGSGSGSGSSRKPAAKAGAGSSGSAKTAAGAKKSGTRKTGTSKASTSGSKVSGKKAAAKKAG